MEYRKDIDGLRAIAVLPVILFHAGISLFSGGFLGVDIFFVISGYLISGIILNDLEKGNFTIGNFYERRIRRIIPALFTVLIFSSILAYFILLPGEMRKFSQSLFSTIFFASNIFFWLDSNYFDAGSELKPLLHTWSLSVEEQFYIFFPLLMILIWKLPSRSQEMIIFLLLLLSLTITSIPEFANSSTKFYWLPFRAWELLIGVTAMYISKKSLIQNSFINNLASMIGFFAILFPMIFYDSETPTPSLSTLIPCLGCFLLLVCGNETTFIGKILSTNLLVFIGLLSYSAYLWHQPLFVFGRILNISELSLYQYAFLIFLTFVLAFLSYKFIETPIRNRKKLSFKPILISSSALAIILATFGLRGHFTEGYMERFSEDELANYLIFENEIDACIGNKQKEMWCLVEDSKFLILGDSHADALSRGFAEDDAVSKIILYGCPPIINIVKKNDNFGADCNDDIDYAFEYLASNDQIEYVILHSRWPLFVEQKRFNNREGGVEYGDSIVISFDNKLNQNFMDSFKSSLFETVEKISSLGKKIIIVYPVPEVGWHVPTVVTRNKLLNRSTDNLSTSYDVFLDRASKSYEILDSIKKDDVIRIYPEKIFCNSFMENRCVAYMDGNLFYGDDDHLSVLGARILSEQIKNEIVYNPEND